MTIFLSFPHHSAHTGNLLDYYPSRSLLLLNELWLHLQSFCFQAISITSDGDSESIALAGDRRMLQERVRTVFTVQRPSFVLLWPCVTSFWPHSLQSVAVTPSAGWKHNYRNSSWLSLTRSFVMSYLIIIIKVLLFHFRRQRETKKVRSHVKMSVLSWQDML